MNKKKEENPNPYHKEYGLFNNMRYTLRNMLRVEPTFYILIPLGVLSATVIKYLWTFISKSVIDLITGEAPEYRLYWLMALFFLIRLFAAMLDTLFSNEIFWRYIHTRFEMLYDKNMKIMSMDYENLEDPDIMDCYQKADNACNTNKEGIEGMMRGIVNFLMNAAVVIAGIAILGTMNPVVMLLITALAAVNFLIRNHANKKAKRLVWDPLAKWERKHSYIRNTTTDFNTAKEVRMYSLRGWLLEKYRSINLTRYEAQKENEKITFFATLSSYVLWAGAQLFLYGWLLHGVIRRGITIGSFTLYLASAATLFESLKKMLSIVSDLLARSREVDDFRSFLDLDTDHGAAPGESLPGMQEYAFTFHNVSFKYPKAERYALKNLNLTIKAGERLALVGLNGAGKSTVIKLLLRLYDPTEGEILLNGVNIKNMISKAIIKSSLLYFRRCRFFPFP